MAINIYLNFDGNTREVVETYAKVFSLPTPEFMTFGSQPEHPEYKLPEEAKDLIMHARLDIDGSTVMFSDLFPGMEHVSGKNFSLSFNTSDEAALRSAFAQLLEGGEVIHELQETSWSKCYGGLTDKFGIQWMFNLEA